MPMGAMVCPIAMPPPCGFSSYSVCTLGPRAPLNASHMPLILIDTLHGGLAHTHHLRMHRGQCECKCDAWHCEVCPAHDSSRYNLLYDGTSTPNSLPRRYIALGVAFLLSRCSADDASRGGGSTCQRDQCCVPSLWRLHEASCLIQCVLQAPGHRYTPPIWL